MANRQGIGTETFHDISSGETGADPMTDLPQGLLQTSLLLAGVVAPELAETCPGPISLAVGLQEFVLVEGLGTHAADLLLRLAATLRRPAAGRIFHWGRDLFALSRQALYPWRMQLALVSPLQSLLPRLTVLENVTLSQTLTTARSAGEVVQEHRALLEQLALLEYLPSYPEELPRRQYQLALWARELIKRPRLILGVMADQAEQCDAPDVVEYVFPWLEEYHNRRRGAVVLAGPALEFGYQVADRRVHCQAGRWQEQPLPGRDNQPLLGYVELW
jgi:ABC-type polar amino acid transport system ATPase subunit